MSENPERTSTSTGPLWNHEITDENMILRLAALHEAYALLDPYVAEEVNSVDAIELACFIITGRTLSTVEAEVEQTPTPILDEMRKALAGRDFHVCQEGCGHSSEPPRPGELECEETDYDSKGDCDGPVNTYVTKTFVLGHAPGDKIALCESHLKFRLTTVDGYPDQRRFAPKIERTS